LAFSRTIVIKNFLNISDDASQVFEWTKIGQLKNYYSLCLEIEKNNDFIIQNKCDKENLNQRWSYDNEVEFIIPK
jgi:hypothetical protein